MSLMTSSPGASVAAVGAPIISSPRRPAWISAPRITSSSAAPAAAATASASRPSSLTPGRTAALIAACAASTTAQAPSMPTISSRLFAALASTSDTGDSRPLGYAGEQVLVLAREEAVRPAVHLLQHQDVGVAGAAGEMEREAARAAVDAGEAVSADIRQLVLPLESRV